MSEENTTPVPPIVANTAALAKAQATKPAIVAPSEASPCNWEFSWDGDVLHAKNIITGRKFEGSKAEFNELLKG